MQAILRISPPGQADPPTMPACARASTDYRLVGLRERGELPYAAA